MGCRGETISVFGEGSESDGAVLAGGAESLDLLPIIEFGRIRLYRVCFLLFGVARVDGVADLRGTGQG